ncbi:aminotransferase class I/II-fold pyridoxal phosphate-dependent enzyme [Listeria sp. PSOL-1]|uniref:aminotransferase class I/II-fold pyridoxal phosphate-dependent enzyme n=1 Tax=Listeria sp. PSOL-1 TaxID=1844999 RepID=UPI0013D50F1C|nr:aminotransferase class I/II-fold pyridoxal phosphate-dependent enzyme [Listeria sp. PSOL-1]
MENLKKQTILAQIGNKKCSQTGAVNMPLYFSTAYRHHDIGVSTGYDYIRTGNPTRDVLEEALALLEGGRYAFATSSGMSAIQLVFERFQTGDHIISVQDLYGGSFRYFRQLEERTKIQFSYWQGNHVADLKYLLKPNTKAIFLETPTNPLMMEIQINEVVEFAKKHHLLVIVDNTFYTPILQQPLDMGADIVVHSATKYLGGHNDLLAGVVVVKDSELGDFFQEALNRIGCVLAPFDSWLLIRGLKTLSLRMKQHQENAIAIADFLFGHPLVEEVRYPGRGGMISFFVKDEEIISPLLKSLKLFTFAESLGGVESLITYPTTQTHADIPPDLRRSYGLTDNLLRISVGVEDKSDLLFDLEQAFEAVGQNAKIH